MGYLERRTDREKRGLAWEADPPWIRCIECNASWRTESVVFWSDGPVCMQCFTIELVRETAGDPDELPTPVLHPWGLPDYTPGAALPQPSSLSLRSVELLFARRKLIGVVLALLSVVLIAVLR